MKEKEKTKKGGKKKKKKIERKGQLLSRRVFPRWLPVLQGQVPVYSDGAGYQIPTSSCQPLLAGPSAYVRYFVPFFIGQRCKVKYRQFFLKDSVRNY